MLPKTRTRAFPLFCAMAFILLSSPCYLAGQEAGTSVPDHTGFTYTVKKGDTLWDIANRFFDSPWLWPEVWSENKQIANPHLIYPGNRIRIYRKNGMIMFEQAPPPEPAEVEEPIEIAAVEQAPIEVEETPVLVEQDNLPEMDELQGPYFPWALIDAVGFVRKEAAVSHGTIFKVKEKKELLSVGDTVYIKQENKNTPPLIPGSLYVVYHILEDPVTDVDTGKEVGLQHDKKGIAEITEVISEDPLIAEARIVRSFRTIEVGDFLMPYNKRSPKIPIVESVKGLDGKILATVNRQDIFARAVAFIDKGEKDGVKPGQQYSIYYQEILDPVVKNIDIGSLTVLHTEEDTSTVVITNVQQDLRPGAKIRTPVR